MENRTSWPHPCSPGMSNVIRRQFSVRIKSSRSWSRAPGSEESVETLSTMLIPATRILQRELLEWHLLVSLSHTHDLAIIPPSPVWLICLRTTCDGWPRTRWPLLTTRGSSLFQQPSPGWRRKLYGTMLHARPVASPSDVPSKRDTPCPVCSQAENKQEAAGRHSSTVQFRANQRRSLPGTLSD